MNQVAVKMLPSEQFSKNQLQAFLNEVQSLHSLHRQWSLHCL